MDTTARSGSFRSALSHRDLRYLLAGHAVSATGQSLHGVALVVVVFQQTHSAGWVAAASFSRLIPYVLFSTFGGVVADRYERRRVMLCADLMRAILMLLLTAVVTVGAPVPVALTISLASTTLGTPYYPALAAALPSVVGTAELVAANAVMTTIESAAFIIGPAVGGLLLAVGAPSFAFAINAAIFGVSFLCVWRVGRRSFPGRHEVDAPFGRRLAEGFGAIRASGSTATLLSFVFVVNLVYGFQLVLLIFVAQDLLEAGSKGFGFLNTGLGLGALAAVAVTNRLAKSHRTALILAVAVVATALPFGALAGVGAPGLATD